MWFSLFTVVLILAITFYQGLLGLFSSVINCILTLLAAALAFGFYEEVYYSFLIDRQPNDGRAMALIGIFVVSLLVLRVIFDAIIKDGQHYQVYADRIGGGVFGFITAMVIMGTLTTSIQMLPFDHAFLGFTRYRLFNAESGEAISMMPTEPKQSNEEVLSKIDFSKVNSKRQSIWFKPDDFTAGLVSLLSKNGLTGGNSLAAVHPDLIDELYWARFNPLGQKKPAAGKPDDLRVEATYILPEDELYTLEAAGVKETEGNQPVTRYKLVEPGSSAEKPAAGHRWLVTRVKLDTNATEEGTTFRFTTQQVRLVARTKSGRTEAYRLIGIDLPSSSLTDARSKRQTWHYRVYPGQGLVRKAADSSGRFDWVFEVPDDATPLFVEYKQNARAGVSAIAKEVPPALGAPPGSGGNNNKQGGNQQNTKQPKPKNTGTEGTGRISRLHANKEGSFYSNDLPFELTQYSAQGMEIRGEKIEGGSGSITATLDENDKPVPGNERPIRGFVVPSGQQLLHLSVTRLTPGSLTGQVFDFAAQNNNNYVLDATGKQYPAVGLYAVATSRGKRVLEIVYFDETTRMSPSAIPKPKRLSGPELRQNDTEMFYLFFIPSGTRINRFQNPRGHQESLDQLNLVAP